MKILYDICYLAMRIHMKLLIIRGMFCFYQIKSFELDFDNRFRVVETHSQTGV